MPSSCCAVGCKNRHTSGTPKKFFRFPKMDLERRKLWIQALGRENWEPNDGSRICSDHFLFGDKSDNKDSLNYVPSIFPVKSKPSGLKKIKKLDSTYTANINTTGLKSPLRADTRDSTIANSSSSLQNNDSEQKTRIGGSDSEASCNPEFMEPETLLYCLEENENSTDNSSENQKHKRKKKAQKIRPKVRPKREVKSRQSLEFISIDEIFKSEEEDTDSAPEVHDFIIHPKTVHDQETQTILQHTYIQNLEDECYNLRCELARIKGRYMFKDMELEMFKENDEKVRYLTGLESYDMLKALGDVLCGHQRNLSRLSNFQQLMVTLMKIKLNLPMKFFSVLYNVNLTGVSRLFNETIDLLFKKLVPLYIKWPNRNDMRKILPVELSDCQNCVYITDTFELQIDLSSGTAISSFNKMDGGNGGDLYHAPKGLTVRKYLMTIAPQGSVIFISRGVVGEVTDRTIALESGFFENIAPGDVILTEKELGIDEVVAVMGATLRNSNSVKSSNKSLINQGDEDGAKRLVRIKRIIQLMKKKFMILDNKIPVNWVKDSDKDSHTTLDKIVQIVCALSNMTNKVWTYEKYLESNAQNIAA